MHLLLLHDSCRCKPSPYSLDDVQIARADMLSRLQEVQLRDEHTRDRSNKSSHVILVILVMLVFLPIEKQQEA